MKAYTDLEQSKELAKILPLESADMWWVALNWQETEYYVEVKQDDVHQPNKAIPCWSLTALLVVIPKSIGDNNVLRMDYGEDFSIWYDEIGYGVNFELPDITADNPIDACYKMIIELHELNLL